MGNPLKLIIADIVNLPFIFKIDTTKIVSGATDGSENPLTFRLPVNANSTSHSGVVVKVSDGRPDIGYNGSASAAALTLTFATSGIYEIQIYGKFQHGFSFGTSGGGFDRLKIIEITQWSSNSTFFAIRPFQMCSNLIVNASNSLVLPSDSGQFFQGIKGFLSSLSMIDTSKVLTTSSMFSQVQTAFLSVLNPFWLNILSFTNVYSGCSFIGINKIEVISDSLTTFSQGLNGVTTNLSTLRLVFKTPNMTTMFRFFYSGDIRTKCHGGEIDVRNVTNPDQWLAGAMATANVDATLLGWSQLPFMQAGVTWNWQNSKYSNNPAVIEAHRKITQDWGVIFTNLTML